MPFGFLFDQASQVETAEIEHFFDYSEKNRHTFGEVGDEHGKCQCRSKGELAIIRHKI